MGLSDLGFTMNNFKLSTFFIIGIIMIVVLTLLALYCFYVIPLEIGTADHPLFFLGKSWEEKDYKIKSNSVSNLDMNQSNAS